VADPAELDADAAVLPQHGGDVGALAEVPREPRHAQDLQVADGLEQHARHEEHGGAVDPRRHLQRARGGGPPEREGPVGAVPEHLVGGVGEEAGEHEAGEEAEGAGELDDVPGAHVLGVVAEAVEVEQPAQAPAADEGVDGGVGERGGERERCLHLRVVGAPGQRGARDARDGHGERGEDEPGRRGAGGLRVVDAHPPQAGPEAAELVTRVRHGPRVRAPPPQQRRRHGPRLGGRRRRRRVRHRYWPRGFSISLALVFLVPSGRLPSPILPSGCFRFDGRPGVSGGRWMPMHARGELGWGGLWRTRDRFRAR
jgi:hypothetical protein